MDIFWWCHQSLKHTYLLLNKTVFILAPTKWLKKKPKKPGISTVWCHQNNSSVQHVFLNVTFLLQCNVFVRFPTSKLKNKKGSNGLKTCEHIFKAEAINVCLTAVIKINKGKQLRFFLPPNDLKILDFYGC